jgi:phosphopantothenoylcysteine decarboxylase/phosphopantothenate--cysteine ligase
MARILITSGPTRQYLDPVRFLSNASSGRMGQAIAAASIRAGHAVIVVSGPVQVRYPKGAEVIEVETTDEMLKASLAEFPSCDGLIGVAAPCDYKPRHVAAGKITKSGGPLRLELVETPDIVATLGQRKKPHQWSVGFALETGDARFRALAKLEAKHCDLMVVNSAAAINAAEAAIEILAPGGQVIASASGPKSRLARLVVATVQKHLLGPVGRV